MPIIGGGRLTGRAGAYSIGLVNIQTKEDRLSGQPSTNFAVARIRRDILRRSNIGVIAINRSANGSRRQGNQTFGVDGVFSFFEHLNINTFVIRTHTPGLRENPNSHRVQLEYNADRYGLVLENMMIGKHFNPEVGLCAAHRRASKHGAGSLQPASPLEPHRSPVRVFGKRRSLHASVGRPARYERDRRDLWSGVPEQRRPQGSAARQRRAIDGALRGVRRHRDSRRQIRFQEPDARITSSAPSDRCRAR